MKPTGIVRRLDSNGRLVIPSEIREQLNWRIGDPIEISLEMDCARLKSRNHFCFFCGTSNTVKNYKQIGICNNCISEMQQLQ